LHVKQELEIIQEFFDASMEILRNKSGDYATDGYVQVDLLRAAYESDISPEGIRSYKGFKLGLDY